MPQVLRTSYIGELIKVVLHLLHSTSRFPLSTFSLSCMSCESISKSLCPPWGKLPLWLMVLVWTLLVLYLLSLYLSTPPSCLNGCLVFWFVYLLLLFLRPFAPLRSPFSYYSSFFRFAIHALLCNKAQWMRLRNNNQ